MRRGFFWGGEMPVVQPMWCSSWHTETLRAIQSAAGGAERRKCSRHPGEKGRGTREGEVNRNTDDNIAVAFKGGAIVLRCWPRLMALQRLGLPPPPMQRRLPQPPLRTP